MRKVTARKASALVIKQKGEGHLTHFANSSDYDRKSRKAASQCVNQHVRLNSVSAYSKCLVAQGF